MQFDKTLLTLIATVGTFVLLVLLMFQPLPKDNAQIYLAVITFLLGYYFGSSNRTAVPPKEANNETPDPASPDQPIA
jgi:hypothetical protein